MRGSEWLGRAGERQVLFEHVSKKSHWNADVMKQQGFLYWMVETKSTASTQLCYVCKKRLNGNQYQKSPQIPHIVKSCIQHICMLCVPVRYNVKRVVLDSYMQNLSSRCDLSTDLWNRTGVIP